MKKIFNLVAFFFILVISLVFALLSELPTIQVQSLASASDYIREVKTETVVLISSYSSRGELASRQSDNNLGFSSLFSYLLSFNSNNIFFEKQLIGFNTNCFYNLVNNLLNINNIRAPKLFFLK